jgi:[acyl-carrier-protein] S-malonyltransferase
MMLRFQLVQNTTASAVTSSAEIKENLKKQMTGSVRWTETVKFFFDNGISEIFEVGPGKVLAGLVKKQDRRFPVKNIASLEDLKALEAAVS